MVDAEHVATFDTSLRLDEGSRAELLAVVVDANAYGRAKPNLDDLEHMARRLHGIGKQTWVPEPVAWEWAEHLGTDWRTLMTAQSDLRKNLRRGRVPMTEPLYEDEAGVIDAFMTAIQAIDHVRVISVTPHSALEGLKDQVLQRPPGKRKEKVKTGGSDAAWLRDVILAANGAVDRLLFLTEDRDITRACEAWGMPTPRTRTRLQLRSTLFDVTVDDERATRAVVRYLLERLPIDLNSGWSGETDGFDIGSTSGLDRAIEAADDLDDTRVYGADITRLTVLVGVDNVAIDTTGDDEPSYPGHLGEARHDQVSATVYFLGDAEATVNRLYLGGDPETMTDEIAGVFIRTELLFHLVDGVITEVSAEDDAQVSLPDNFYDRETDAVDELREALECVPGLIIPDDFGLNTRNGIHRLTIEGHDVDLTLSWVPSDYGRFTLDLSRAGHDFDSVEISCQYDATAWAGGKDGYLMRAPYYMTVENGELLPESPLWSIPAWIIGKLDWTAPATPRVHPVTGVSGVVDQ
ncbi:hypothetical protein [Umezawaea sp.]|uniref:hypothetical protein n=1 Tax=Umezawaea sp. TaxID=1955258 RepID=UPI002ED2A0CF